MTQGFQKNHLPKVGDQSHHRSPGFGGDLMWKLRGWDFVQIKLCKLKSVLNFKRTCVGFST